MWGVHTKSPGNDVHFWHDSVPIADPSAVSPVQPHGMDLIHEGDCSKLMGHITQFLQWTHSS